MIFFIAFNLHHVLLVPHFLKKFKFASGVDGVLKVGELVTGSLCSCDRLGNSGWGKLMYDFFICFLQLLNLCVHSFRLFYFCDGVHHVLRKKNNLPLYIKLKLLEQLSLCCNSHIWNMLKLAPRFSEVQNQRCNHHN